MNEFELTETPEQLSIQKPEDVLNQIGISDILKKLEHGDELGNFASKRLIEHSLVNPLPAFNLQESINDNNLKNEVEDYYKVPRPSTIILNSSSLKLLSANGWRILKNRYIDVSSLYSANNVETMPIGLSGDYLLKDVFTKIGLFLKNSDRYLARVGGDEAVILEKGDKPFLTEQEIKDSIKGSKVLLKGKNGLNFGPAKIKFTQTSPNVDKEEKDTQQYTEKIYSDNEKETIDKRILSLKNFHKDISTLLTDENKLSYPEKEKFLFVYEELLYDPMAKGTGQEIYAKYSEDIKARFFKDREDFLYHAKEFGDGKVDILYFDLLGALKKINSESYIVGNQFMESMYKKYCLSIVDSLSQNGLKRIHFYRRGLDIYTMVFDNTNLKPESNENNSEPLDSSLGLSKTEQVLYQSFEKAYTVEGEEGVKTIPLIPALSWTSIDIQNTDLETLNNDFSDSQKILNQLNWKKDIVKISALIDGLVNNVESDQDTNYAILDFISSIFNPHDKRGILRAIRLGINKRDLEKLYEFYTPKAFKNLDHPVIRRSKRNRAYYKASDDTSTGESVYNSLLEYKVIKSKKDDFINFLNSIIKNSIQNPQITENIASRR